VGTWSFCGGEDLGTLGAAGTAGIAGFEIAEEGVAFLNDPPPGIGDLKEPLLLLFVEVSNMPARARTDDVCCSSSTGGCCGRI
jgi:hypothetical protein